MEFIPACSLVAVYRKAENIRDEEFRSIIAQFSDVRDAANVARFYAQSNPPHWLGDGISVPENFYMIVDPGFEELGKADPEEYEDLIMISAGVYSL